MKIKLKELLENMTGASGGEPPTAQSPGGVVESPVEDGPSVATACPPTPRRNSSIHAAVEAATIDAASQADFFNPPADPPPAADETDEIEAADLEEVPARPRDRTVPPPIPPARQPPRRDSGLIDVRSMAAAYREYDGLANKPEARGADIETLPLPIMERDGPLLLPQPTAPEPTNRWLYVAVAGLAAILVIGSTVAITALVLKRRDGGSKTFAALSPTERAALCEEEEASSRIREDEERERIAAARRAPAPVPGTVSDSDDVTAAEVAGAGAAPAASKSDDDDHHHRRKSGDDEDADPNEASSSAGSQPTTSAPATVPAPAATPSPPAATDDLAAAAGSATTPSSSDGEPCDEVACLVSGRGCCGKNPKSAAPKSEAPPPDPSLPTRPDRSDISAGIASVESRLQSCGDRHSVRGAVTVKIAIAPGGEVKSASTSQGSGEFQSCIASAIEAARFPATREGAKVSYPVMLK